MIRQVARASPRSAGHFRDLPGVIGTYGELWRGSGVLGRRKDASDVLLSRSAGRTALLGRRWWWWWWRQRTTVLHEVIYSNAYSLRSFLSHVHLFALLLSGDKRPVRTLDERLLAAWCEEERFALMHEEVHRRYVVGIKRGLATPIARAAPRAAPADKWAFCMLAVAPVSQFGNLARPIMRVSVRKLDLTRRRNAGLHHRYAHPARTRQAPRATSPAR